MKKNILVLCTGNSARSILGEVLLNTLGYGRLQAYSAGSQPKGEVHPMSLEILKEKGNSIDHLRSKSWDEFVAEGAPALDIVITVCDSAAGESCPVWHSNSQGLPIKVHWGIEDPAAVEGPGQKQAFETAYGQMHERIEAFLALPFETMTHEDIRLKMQEIGASSSGATQKAKAS